jgi:hypothetical protein
LSLPQQAIDAGANVLLNELGTCDPGPLFLPGRVAEAVWQAMAAHIEMPKARGFVLKLDATEFREAIAELQITVDSFTKAVESAQEIEP